MCGICGFTGYRQDQKTVIERMMKAIEHRGPDSEGSFCREKITLGFRRLSIIDLEDGQQSHVSRSVLLPLRKYNVRPGNDRDLK